MSFRDRMLGARPWEQVVLRALQRNEWAACAYGQGMLTPEVREALRRIDSPIRWHPDIIAVRGNVVYFVDPKTGRTDTPNHGIEQSALAAYQDWYIHSRIPIVIVWRDVNIDPRFGQRSIVGHCNFHWELLAEGSPLTRMPGTTDAMLRGDGSGTAGWLWPKSACHLAPDIFGIDAPAFGPPSNWRMRDIRRAA